MFGESESESPRAGSPWDTFLDPSSSPPSNESAVRKHIAYDIPRLSPEVEEGNVEYKLKLLNPSAERFTRLVTQLKWRLLEGGGQAYYELGVSDSGQLIGLSRTHLEQSLQTLEEMAGEIGASVIVVKEIEVPVALFDLAALGRNKTLDGAVRITRKQVRPSPEPTTTEGESNTTDGDTETGLSATEDDDVFGASTDDVRRDILLDAGRIQTELAPSPHLRSNPDRPCTQSTPPLLHFDEDADADTEVEFPEPLSIDLEIASVYKPRPSRKRVPVMSCRAKSYSNALDGLAHMPLTTSKKPWMKDPTMSLSKKDRRLQLLSKSPEKATRDTRDERRAKAKAKAERDRNEDSVPMTDPVSSHSSIASRREYNPELSKAIPIPKQSHIVQEMSTLVSSMETLSIPDGEEPALYSSTTLVDNSESTDSDKSDEPLRRLIVEALVVRKMSLEEAFLDFGVFSLEP